MFTAEDLLAVTMLSVWIEGYHALRSSATRPAAQRAARSDPPNVALQDPGPALIAKDGPAWKLWDTICDIEPRPESNRIGPVAAGKLLARKRPDLLPVYDSRIKKVLKRPRVDNRWWHDLHDQLINDQRLVRELASVRDKAEARATCPCSASST